MLTVTSRFSYRDRHFEFGDPLFKIINRRHRLNMPRSDATRIHIGEIAGCRPAHCPINRCTYLGGVSCHLRPPHFALEAGEIVFKDRLRALKLRQQRFACFGVASRVPASADNGALALHNEAA